jgi:hypothetical protein
MRRLTPVLLTSLLCSASAFAGEDVATESRARPTRARNWQRQNRKRRFRKMHCFISSSARGTCAMNSLTKMESQGAIEARCIMAGSSAAKLCRRLGLRTRKARTRSHSARRLISTTSSVSAGGRVDISGGRHDDDHDRWRSEWQLCANRARSIRRASALVDKRWPTRLHHYPR